MPVSVGTTLQEPSLAHVPIQSFGLDDQNGENTALAMVAYSAMSAESLDRNLL